MAIRVDPTTATIAWTTSGAVPACHIGKQFAILHCTKGANLRAGDFSPAGKVRLFDAVELEGRVFVEAGPQDFDIGDRQFGMVQTTELMFYEFVYAGRRDSEGSCRLNPLAGFSKNPSLDVETNAGQSTDGKIFDPATVLIDAVKTPKKGFNITVRFGDHPHNTIPYRFQNSLTGARNYLAMAARAQKFMVYFVTRANATAPIEILAKFNWVVDWIVEFTWTVKPLQATAHPRRVDILQGESRQGFFFPLLSKQDPTDQIVINRSGPSTNKQDEDAVKAIYNRRQEPLLTQSKHWPKDFQTNFFT